MIFQYLEAKKIIKAKVNRVILTFQDIISAVFIISAEYRIQEKDLTRILLVKHCTFN